MEPVRTGLLDFLPRLCSELTRPGSDSVCALDLVLRTRGSGHAGPRLIDCTLGLLDLVPPLQRSLIKSGEVVVDSLDELRRPRQGLIRAGQP